MSDPVNPYASPQVEEKLSPGARWVSEMSPSLRRTGLGLTLVYYGIVLMILAFFGMGGAVALQSLPAIGAAGFAVLAATLLMFVGPLVCLAVPAESGAKGFLLGSVFFQLANIGYAVAMHSAWLAPQISSPLLRGVLQLLGLVGFVLFVLFMKRLSEFINRSDLAQKARNVLVGMVVLIGLGVAAVAGPAAGVPALSLLFLAVGIGGLVLFVMYANLVNYLGNALRKK